MKLIVGLGNPGVRYENTRHNAGFMVADEVASRLGLSFDREKFEARIAEGHVNGEKIIVMKPETFMNNSGHAIRQCMDFYRLAPEDVLVIYDDLDTSVGNIRLRQKGSAGGHNGMKSVILCMLTDQFNRIRVGIGRNPQIKVIDYVLGRFPKEEKEKIESAVQKAADAVIDSLNTPFSTVMSRFNEPKKPVRPHRKLEES